MRKHCKRTVLTVPLLILAMALAAVPLSVGAIADDKSYSVAPDTPFSSQTGNGVSHRCTMTEKLADGSYRITQDTSLESESRLFYGEGNRPYGVDLSDFTMKFSFDQFKSQQGVYGGFSIAFLTSGEDYPMDSYGRGLSIRFNDIDNAFEMHLYLHSEAGQRELTSYYLVYNNNGRPDCTGKTIVLSLGNEEGNEDNLLLDIRYELDDGTTEADMVAFRAQIAKTELEATGLNLSSATLFFAPRSGLDGDLVYTISSISEPNMAAYLASAERAAVLEKLESLESAFAAFKSYGEYDAYLTENQIDLNVLRAYDRADNLAFYDGAYAALVGSLIPSDSKVMESVSNFTPSVRNNQDGSYAEVLADGREKLILVNRFTVDGSSMGLKKTVDLSDFTFKFTVDQLYDTRFGLIFGPSFDCYNFGEMTIPGLAVSFMFSGNGMNIFLENPAGAQAIEGLDTNEYHILKNAEGGWLTLPVSQGAEIAVTLKTDNEGNLTLHISAGGQSAQAVISAGYFAGNELDLTQMYFKLVSGHQANVFGSEKYLELTVTELSDASNAAAVARIQSFLTQAGSAADAETAAGLLADAPSVGELYLQQAELIESLTLALNGLKETISDDLTALVETFASAAAKVEDVSASKLNAADVENADAARTAFYRNAEYLDLLTVAQINAIRAILDPADYLLVRAQLYLKINEYTAKAAALTTKEDVSAAQALREKITAAELSKLNSADRQEAQEVLEEADRRVSDKDKELNPAGGCTCGTVGGNGGSALMMLAVLAVLSAILLGTKKSKQTL